MVLRSLLSLLLGVSLLGCKSDSACSGDNGKMCDIFPTPVTIDQQAVLRLHFTSWQPTEGTCSPPTCLDRECTAVRFEGAKLPAVAPTEDGGLPDVSCRFLAATTEGATLDVQLKVARVAVYSHCCCTGQPNQGGCQAAMRTFTGVSWSVSIDGADLGTNTVHLVHKWDGGLADIDAS